MATKRKRVVLSIQDKLKVIEMLDKSVSFAIIMERFGIGKSTVSDIKKNKAKIIAFSHGYAKAGQSYED